MRMYTILAVALAAACSDIADDPIAGSSESGAIDRAGDLVAEPDVQADGPVFEAGELFDQCCPLLADGRTLDQLCGHDVNDTCPTSSGYTTGWSLDGSMMAFITNRTWYGRLTRLSTVPYSELSSRLLRWCSGKATT